LIGKVFWDVFPETRGTNLETEFFRAMTERARTRFENYYSPWQRWFEIRLYPTKDCGLSIFYQDITTRKQADEAIRIASEALRIANADLEQFAYSASHDLREPLRMICTYCELLSRRYAGKMDRHADEMLAYCVEGARRAYALLDDLLAYVRASTGQGEPAESLPLESALDEALKNLHVAIHETAAIITHDPMPSLRVATVHAQQLFQNLIGNALKYRSAATPRVHVSARREGGMWVFSVQDNGIGIAPEHTEQVFGVFKRLHSASEYSGSGIGLAICRKVVERYGGRIWIESELNKGTSVSFALPACEQART
jgi:light-regulated signal transduction histidine kinase (bacteriophytochrome)